MSLDLADDDAKARAAVKRFWSSRAQAARRQGKGGRHDQGERAAVTAGKNMDGFVNLVRDPARNSHHGSSRARANARRSWLARKSEPAGRLAAC